MDVIDNLQSLEAPNICMKSLPDNIIVPQLT
jgi:hypothetical protein